MASGSLLGEARRHTDTVSLLLEVLRCQNALAAAPQWNACYAARSDQPVAEAVGEVSSKVMNLDRFELARS
jgi:hypothetical protein